VKLRYNGTLRFRAELTQMQVEGVQSPGQPTVMGEDVVIYLYYQPCHRYRAKGVTFWPSLVLLRRYR
jgi:hypothetical protein